MKSESFDLGRQYNSISLAKYVATLVVHGSWEFVYDITFVKDELESKEGVCCFACRLNR